jgi:hypothetical protein
MSSSSDWMATLAYVARSDEFPIDDRWCQTCGAVAYWMHQSVEGKLEYFCEAHLVERVNGDPGRALANRLPMPDCVMCGHGASLHINPDDDDDARCTFCTDCVGYIPEGE